MEKYQLELDSQGKCGIGIVIVNKYFSDPKFTRGGAEQEVEYLKRLLDEEFCLEVHVYENMNSLDMRHLMTSLLSGKRESKSIPQIEKRHQILVFAISSHGTDQGIITYDMKILKFHLIKTLFNSKSCEFLIDKPKMFLFNCCRTLEDRIEREERAYPILREQIETDGLSSDGEADVDPKLRVASCWSDFITVNFCSSGIVSLRNTDSGSLAIEEFYQAFKSYGRKMDFQSFMTKFTREVKIRIFQIMEHHRDIPVTQCPEVITTLDRQLYFPLKPTQLEGQDKSKIVSQEMHHTSQREMSHEDHPLLGAPEETSQRVL